MYMDQTTEAIAHFIGLFETTLEQARLREAHQEFWAGQSVDEEAPTLSVLNFRMNAEQPFVGFQPYVPYKPLGWQLENVRSTSLALEPIMVRVPDVGHGRQQFLRPDDPLLIQFNGLSSTPSFSIDPPGNLSIQINQANALSDNDYSSVGRHGLTLTASFDDELRVKALLSAASDLSPLPSFAMTGLSAGIINVIATATEALAAYPEMQDGDADVFVVKADFITGTYVNGELVTEAPEFETYRPAEEEEEPEVFGPKQESLIEGSIDQVSRPGNQPAEASVNTVSAPATGETFIVQASVDLLAGGNALFNSVGINNQWLDSAVFATLGNHIELNAIVQINAWQDTDLIGSDFGAWLLDTEDPTLGFNIATFTRIDPAAEAAAPTSDDFPSYWAVTRITGDLIILNWIEQFSFMLDNDVSIISAAGSKLTAITGENTAVNAVSSFELGFEYDLIFIGGNIYDANLIHQLNVLFDNDMVGAVDGFAAAGGSSVATAGNLLWNQAEITQIGGAGRFDLLPQHYREAADSLASGGRDLPGDVLRDDAFAGLGPLRVLYVSGDFLNLQYIRQTNVLGDGDKVALAMDALQARPDAKWTVSAGANTLVNGAAIVDIDASGKTYVGGERYSDEILIQAELMSSDPMLGARNPNSLVNEAVAFLADDMLDPSDGSGGHSAYGMQMPDAPHADIMQTMLA